MGSRASLDYQFQRAMRSLEATGESKYDDRQAGRDTQEKTYGITTQKQYSDIQGRFAAYVGAQFGVRYAKDLNEIHGTAYLDRLADAGLSASYIKQNRSALEKLSIGIRKEYGDGEVKLVRDDWVSPRRSLDTRADNHGPYSPKEANQIIERLERTNPQAALVATIQRECNSRIGALLGNNKTGIGGIRVRQVDFDKGVIHLQSKDTKGGREQELAMTPKVVEGLREYIAAYNLKPGDKVFKDFGYQSYMSAIKWACHKLEIQSKGNHGFRGTWAGERIEAVEAKYANAKTNAEFAAMKAEMLEISKAMNHSRLEVLESYRFGR